LLLGSFYSGDSYILLNTYKKKPDAAAYSWDVHFWLGKFTTQDEAGTAAYKTVELDDLLGGAPVQHREVQGYESDLFLKYFNNQIRIMDGGVDSGFKHVEPEKYRVRTSVIEFFLIKHSQDSFT
jgi:gelsolin